MSTKQLDEARLEWEFEKLREEHKNCCSGAILLDDGMWCNVITPLHDSPTYRSFDGPASEHFEEKYSG